MLRTLRPAQKLRGSIRLPGDKSISHRYGMLTSIAEGESVISNYSTGADCAGTLECMRRLGVSIERDDVVRVQGVGLDGLKQPDGPLDVGNSGSTIRMLSGILAGQPFDTELAGDESIAQRPMGRVIKPLEQMGARIESRDGNFPPLKIHGANLRAIEYAPPVASAQVKSATLFGGIYAEGTTVVRELLKTRDHSEIALRHLGADLEVDGLAVRLKGRLTLKGQTLRVPSDISSAAFFIVAGLLLPGSEIEIDGVGLNPTRTALLDVLQQMGAAIEVRPDDTPGEPVGTIVVRGGEPIEGGEISGETTAGVIDEVPVLAVLGARSRQGLRIRDAGELQVKETDRIETVADNLQRMGVTVESTQDTMTIHPAERFKAAGLDSFTDHRIAMAFSVAALAADGESEMTRAEAASVSFPEFYDTIDSLRS